jgi:riboflavin kinase/FMN adenylyltransferase
VFAVIVASWEEFLAGALAVGPSRRGPRARITVGAFDGLHLGHRQLIRAVTAAGEGGVPAPLGVVVTFRRPPAQVLGTTGRVGLILSLAQRLRRMAALGVGAAVLIDFSEEISTLSGRDFIDRLRGRLAIERVVVGPNFRFGRNRDADVHDLEAMLAGGPTTVQVIEQVRLGAEIVSSSRIRRAIRDGELSLASRMLAAPHEIDLDGMRWAAAGSAVLRFTRTAVDQLLPDAGRFAVTGRCAEGGVPGVLEAAGESVVVRFARAAAVTALTFDTEATKERNERSLRDGTDH